MDIQLHKQEYEDLRQSIKEWIISINQEEKLPEGINALNFGLFEPYGVELIGAKRYDPNDDDWACEEDFVPKQRECPGIEVSKDIDWEDFLNIIVRILKELIVDLKELDFLKIEHITTGFCDGDLVAIR